MKYDRNINQNAKICNYQRKFGLSYFSLPVFNRKMFMHNIYTTTNKNKISSLYNIYTTNYKKKNL